MIEAVLIGNQWAWRMIGACGAVLVYNDDRFDTNTAAFAAGKAYRATFWAMACRVDHRMGACL